MRETRRSFLLAFAVCGGTLAAAGALAIAQDGIKRGGMPSPPPPAEPNDQDTKDSPSPNPQAAKRAELIRNEKEFREAVDRLYQLSSDLRDEVQKTPSTQVFSVHTYKMTDEIEKLAKQLKTKAKG